MSAESGGVRIGRWLLGGMIALNIALALLLAAVLMGWRSGGGGWVSGPMPNPHALRQALPKERAGLVNQVLDQHKADIRTAMREQRKARRELYRSLRETEPGRDQLSQRFADLREAEQSTAVAVHEMLSDLLSQLTPEERRKVADLFARRGGHQGRERRDGRQAEKAVTESDQDSSQQPQGRSGQSDQSSAIEQAIEQDSGNAQRGN